MASVDNTSRPEQYAAPVDVDPNQLAALPHDDSGPKLNAVIWTLTALSGLILALRIYCRFWRRKGLWWDDAFLIAAWLCITVESAMLTKATTLDYGKHIWDFDMANMRELLLYINIAGSFSVTAAIWAKTSFGITLLHLTDGWIKMVTWVIIISMNIAMGLSALFPWVNCKPLKKSWDYTIDGTCWAHEVTVHYNIFSGAYSTFMDFALALLPWGFIWKLQMRKKEKFGVGVAMSMGILAGITGIVKVSKIPNMLSNDFADGVDLWCWGNAETTVTIIAASIPMLRVIIREAAGSRQTYGAEYYKEGMTTGKRNVTGNVTISRGGPMGSDVEMAKQINDDSSSDKGILDNSNQDTFKMGRIVKTHNFTIEYHSRDSHQGGH